MLDLKARTAFELLSSIDALTRTIVTWKKGMAGKSLRQRFLQGGVGPALNPETVTTSDQTNVLSFLSGGSCDGGSSAPQKGETVGMLKHLKAAREGDLDRKTSRQGRMKAMVEEISVLTKTTGENIIWRSDLTAEAERMLS